MKISELCCGRNKFSISVLVFALIFSILSSAAFAQTKANGETCAGNSECQSGICQGGLCSAISGGATSTTSQPTTTTSQQTTTTTSGATTSSSTATTSGGGRCSDGPIPSSGCHCPDVGPMYYSGYCCSNVYQASGPCGGGATSTTYTAGTTYPTTTYSGTTYTAGTTYPTTTYSGGTKSDGSRCSLNDECSSHFCSGGVCTSSGPGYPGATATTYTGGTYPTYTTYSAPAATCSSGAPWYCYKEDDCKRIGANWCSSGSGGGYCTSATCSTYQQPHPTYVATTYQQCEQKTVSAVDDANHCSFYRSPCDVPPGWKVVDKCPEFKPDERYKQPPQVRPNVPEGCHEEQDPYGGIRVVCPQKVDCPTLENEQQQKEKCKTGGGNPIVFKDRNGCNTMQCQFDSSQDLSFGGGGFTRPLACPPKSQIDDDADKCTKFGGKPVMKTTSGCVYADCLTGGDIEKGKERERKCPQADELKKVRETCEGRNGKAVPFFDESGCEVVHCRTAGAECKKVPEEAFKKCSEEGGQLITRNDNRGCAEYVKCVKKGASSDIEYEKVDEVPDTSELLRLALKLEGVKIEMDKLANKTAALGDYWEGAGNDKEKKRFERVTGMLVAAKDRIDEIKDTMSKKIQAGGVKVNHVLEFKHDLKYIKDVIFENVLYVMLSAEGADAKLTERSDVTEAQARGENVDCGSNGMCFDENVRSCTPSSFHPETFVNVVINGIVGEACSIRVEMTPPIPGQKKTYTADCNYAKYPFGMTGPDDLIPTCTGDGVDLMKRFANEGAGGASGGGPGGPGGRGGPPEGFAGPGGCTSDEECRDYCYEHFDECKKFAKQAGFEKDFKEEYRKQSEQYSSGGYGPPPGFGGEGYGPPGGGGGYGPPGFGGGYPQGPPPGGFPQQPGGYPQGPQQPYQPQQPQTTQPTATTSPPATTAAAATTSTVAATVTTAAPTTTVQATTTTAAPTTTLPPTTTTAAATTTTSG